MYLFVVLNPEPSLAMRAEDAPASIVYGGTVFREITTSEKNGLFLGFFDWLRTPMGRVIGVDLTFHDGMESTQQWLRELGVGTWLAPDVFRILFDSNVEIDEEASVDQEFSVSRIYLGPADQAALLFDASELRGADWQGLGLCTEAQDVGQ